MIGRLVRGWAVRFGAWALRRGVTMYQMEQAVGRSFAHRDAEWRAALVEDMRLRNRTRTMQEISA